MSHTRQICLLSELESLCYPDYVAYDRDTLDEMLGQPGMMMLCEWRERQLAGFQLNDVTTATIITIDVHPDFRRRGIGRFLMRRSLQLLKSRGLTEVFSQVGVTNVPSLMLHFQFGFKQRLRLKNYYGTGDDAWLLVCNL